MKTNRVRTMVVGIVVMVLLISSCGLYSNVKTPMPAFNLQANAEQQNKVGKATAEMYLWFIVLGDCSVATAMKNGDVAKIHHIDTELTSVIFGLYGSFTTVVYGE